MDDLTFINENLINANDSLTAKVLSTDDNNAVLVEEISRLKGQIKESQDKENSLEIEKVQWEKEKNEMQRKFDNNMDGMKNDLEEIQVLLSQFLSIYFYPRYVVSQLKIK